MALAALAMFSAQTATAETNVNIVGSSLDAAHTIVGASLDVTDTIVGSDYHSEELQLCVDPAEAALDEPMMGGCCRYRIVGCGKDEGVCVSGDCNSSNLKKARAAFAKKHSCKGNEKTGQAGDRCNSNKCTLNP